MYFECALSIKRIPRLWIQESLFNKILLKFVIVWWGWWRLEWKLSNLSGSSIRNGHFKRSECLRIFLKATMATLVCLGATNRAQGLNGCDATVVFWLLYLAVCSTMFGASLGSSNASYGLTWPVNKGCLVFTRLPRHALIISTSIHSSFSLRFCFPKKHFWERGSWLLMIQLGMVGWLVSKEISV